MPTVPFLPYLLRFFIENTALRFFLIKYVFLKFRLYIIVCEGECTQSLYKSMYTNYLYRVCVCVQCGNKVRIYTHTLHYAWISNFVVCCSLWLPGIGTELSITSCSIVLVLAQRNLNVQHRTCTETMAAAAFMSSFSFMHASFLLCSLP